MNLDQRVRRLSRREFCSLAAAGVSTLGLTGPTSAQPSGMRRLRVIAYNVYGCTGWPKDRPLARRAVAKGQMAGRFALELALWEPDVVTLSESPDAAVTKRIAEKLGMKHVRFPSGGNWPGTLLSRFEILAAENAPVAGGRRPEDLFTRHWGRAEVRLPGGEQLVVHSAHLHPSNSEIRRREITHMLESMREDLNGGRPMLLMGDLNHEPAPPEHPRWINAGWVDTFARVGQGKGPTIKADRPARRVDYVLAAGPMAERIETSKPLFSGAFRTNPDDPGSFALSDHLPQLAAFQWRD